jgi:hypothetical protein
MTKVRIFWKIISCIKYNYALRVSITSLFILIDTAVQRRNWVRKLPEAIIISLKNGRRLSIPFLSSYLLFIYAYSASFESPIRWLSNELSIATFSHHFLHLFASFSHAPRDFCRRFLSLNTDNFWSDPLTQQINP